MISFARVRRSLLTGAVAFAAAATLGCSDGATAPKFEDDGEAAPLVAGNVDDLAAARQRWEAARITRYRFSEGRACFCVGRGPVRMEVVRSPAPPHQEVVQSLVNEEQPGDPVEYPEFFLTVEQLFEVVRSSLENDVEILVRYHPTHGYPTTVDVEPSAHPVDGGVIYRVTRFEVLARAQ